MEDARQHEAHGEAPAEISSLEDALVQVTTDVEVDDDFCAN